MMFEYIAVGAAIVLGLACSYLVGKLLTWAFEW